MRNYDLRLKAWLSLVYAKLTIKMSTHVRKKHVKIVLTWNLLMTSSCTQARKQAAQSRIFSLFALASRSPAISQPLAKLTVRLRTARKRLLSRLPNLRTPDVQANSASYRQQDEKCVVPHGLWGEGLLHWLEQWYIYDAAPRVRLFAVASNGCLLVATWMH